MPVFDRIIENVEQFFAAASALVWGWPPSWPAPAMVIILVGTGVFLTLRLGLINVRGFADGLRIVRGVYDKPGDPGDVSHFRALTTALSATVGVGNIAGVATAIHFGGPGAIFWMWVTAAFGMTSKYTECTLALHYRVRNADGTVSGGPMYYMERGLGPRFKPVALLFAACAIISSFGTGDAIQAHTMANAMRVSFGIPTWLTGLVSVGLVGLVVVGGIRRIGAFAARVIPLMAALYFAGAVVILLLNYRSIPAAFGAIFAGALRPTAAVGGFAGTSFLYAMIWGVKRGLFSNEAGQGSAPIAHAAAKTEEPVREGLVALLEPFIDTLTICTLTGLVILCTGAWHDHRQTSYPLAAQSSITAVTASCRLGTNGQLNDSCQLRPGRYPLVQGQIDGVGFERHASLVLDARLLADGRPANGTLRIDRDASAKSGTRSVLLGTDDQPLARATLQGRFVENGEPLTAWAFQRGLAPIFPFGDKLVTLCVFLFALSTAIGWSYYGDRSTQYLLGDRAVVPYRFAFLALHFAGAVFSHEGVWGFGDVAQGAMALPNLVTILVLSGRVAQMTRDYYARYRKV